MSRFALLAGALFCATTGCAQGVNGTPVVFAHANSSEVAEGDWTTQTFDGSGYVCGNTFAINLEAKERLLKVDRQMDFMTYEVIGPSGAFLLYEGNAPQDADRVIKTGRTFPTVVAIHINSEASGYSARVVAERIERFADFERICRKDQAGVSQ